MFESGHVKQKVKAKVELLLDDGTVLKGSFFGGVQQRVLEILNDERAFLPFEDSEGTVIVLRKSTIARITLVEQKREHPKLVPTYLGD